MDEHECIHEDHHSSESSQDLKGNVTDENTEPNIASDQKAHSSPGVMHEVIEKSLQRKQPFKRPLFALVEPYLAEVLGNQCPSKQTKLVVSENNGDGRHSHEKLSTDHGVVSSSNFRRSASNETLCEVVRNGNQNNDQELLQFLCPFCDFVAIDDLELKEHAGKSHAEKSSSIADRTTVDIEELSVNCAVGNAKGDSLVKHSNETLAHTLNPDRNTENSLLNKAKENTCTHHIYNGQKNTTLQTLIPKISRPQELFCCKICGFQCLDENLLHDHFFGKAHLRRQHLSARGGFAQLMANKFFSNKPLNAMKQMLDRKKGNKRSLRAVDLKKRYDSVKSLNDARGCSAEQSAGELIVKMIPSAKPSREEPLEVCSELSNFGDCNLRDQSHEGQVSGMSDVGSGKLQTTKTLKTIKPLIGKTTLCRKYGMSSFERKASVLNASFRKNRGSFHLNGQVKNKLNLLSLTKRSIHFRAQVGRMGLASKFVKELKPTCCTDQMTATSTIPSLNHNDSDSWSANATVHAGSKPQPEISEFKVLRTCPYCDHVFQNRKGMEIHVKRCHTKEMLFHCQLCGYSCVTRGDFEKHCLSKRHKTGTFNCDCQLCSFVTSEELIFRSHMSEAHNMPFSCTTCKSYFRNQADLGHHEDTELHLNMVAQRITHVPSKIGLSSQDGSSSSLEICSDSTGPVLHEIEVTMQADSSKQFGLRDESEQQHSALGTPQFQCKKCFYKTRSTTVLTRHIKLRHHAQGYHFLCKACSLYSMCKDGMEKHIKRSKHIENAKKNHIGLLFEECIEKVCIGESNSKQTVHNISGSETNESGRENITEGKSSIVNNRTADKALSPTKGTHYEINSSELVIENAPRRGRPKGKVSRTCHHCGLLASSVTNLTVHIRRKHSRQYSYLCKVCNYYTVTKGDMERHCATRKHKGRVEMEESGKRSPQLISTDAYNTGPNIEKSNVILNGLSIGEDIKAAKSEALSLGEQNQELVNAIGVEVEHLVSLKDVSTEMSTDETGHSFTRTGSPHQEKDPYTPILESSEIGSKCTLCDFVAHSFTSLELHVKRKHTKEFEFYCLACDYYAVTRREMTRHAATEKHKLKRQSYLNCSSGTVTNGNDIANGPAELSKLQNSQLGQVDSVFDGTHSITDEEGHDHHKQKINSAFCVLENPGSSEIDHTADVVHDERHRTLNISIGDHSSEEFKHVALKPNLCSTDVLVETEDDHNADQSNNIQLAPKEHKVNFQNSDRNRNGPIKDKEKPDSFCENSDVPLEDQNMETSSHFVHSVFKESNINSNSGENNTADTDFEKELMVDDEQFTGAHKDTENEVNEGSWDIRNSVTEEMEENETVICENDNPTTMMYSVDTFDSSIVRLRSHYEDGAPSQADDGHMMSEIQLSGYHLKTYLPLTEKRKKFNIVFHGETARVRCDDCGFLADGLSGLNVHISMKHPSKEKHFHCLLCGKSFYTESNLHQHLSSAGHIRNEQASVEELPEGGATFKCVKCTEPFENEQNLFLHIKEQHEELLREVNKYIVEDTEQINREREENQGNVCKYCGKMCRSSNSMAFLAHIRTHTGSKPFKCKICHFATAQLGDARNHVKRHLGMREYKCHICGVAFVMKKHLNTHLLGKHGVGTPKERKFTCNLCDRCFTEKWALNNHMKLHTGEKPYKCTWPTCHYSFLTASAMKDHYRTHTGEKSFLCDLCGFAGGTRHALTKHRRQHTGEKPFKCEECNFASTTQSHLTRHKRVHTGEKPYRCPWCDYRSNCAENIRKHILHTGKHEGVKMYNCPKCEYGTNVPVEFRNHLKELHLDIENPDLAYLHAGIVSKSYECRLKGQGATFVETISTFATGEEGSPIKEEIITSGHEESQSPEQVQQVIIFQGFSEEYNGDFAIDASVEETAAATLQTLAMAGQVARVVHITEDGQVITASQNSSHMGSMTPGQIIREHLQDGTTQVVVVEGPVGDADVGDSIAIETVTDSRCTLVQQVMAHGVLEQSQSALQNSDSSSALDALLCAVTELGEVEDNGHQHSAESCQEDALASQEVPNMSNEIETGEMQAFHDDRQSPIGIESVNEESQVIHSPAIFASQESAQAAFRKMVQGVLEFAVCDSAAADQLMKEGVTQVIVNNEGTVHMLSREGSRIMMRDTSGRALQLGSQHMNLVESDGEISQIIVTEEIAQAMVQGPNDRFPEGATHYFVTELPQGGMQDEDGMFSHNVIETAEAQEDLQVSATVNSPAVSDDGEGQQLTNVVVHEEDSLQTSNTNSPDEQQEA
ncbi:zinc finger protein 407 [Ambystoma mexicanum]|uniref:zinc finger protein 407 n=1 Tax=Ambystoma mexicanum TaxID=8296 RepID=UPI0037E70FB1